MKENRIIQINKIKTSKIELVDITKAWLALSLAFAFVYSGANLINGSIMRLFSVEFAVLFLISLFTAGLGFLLHELAHKFTAQHYSCTAEFRALDKMLYLAVGLAAAIGFIFAAPGAVMISGSITRKENGIISLAGPIVNYALGMMFLGLTFLMPNFSFIWSTGFAINIWLGLFNMIPFGYFDGKKILDWSRYVWALMLIFGGYFIFFY